MVTDHNKWLIEVKIKHPPLLLLIMLAALKKKKKNDFSSVLEDKYKRMPYGMFMLKMKISGVSSIEERES